MALDPKTPPPAAGGEMLLIRPETYEALRAATKNRVLPDSGQFEIFRKDGATYFRLRNPETFPSGKGSGLGQFQIHALALTGGVWKCQVAQGYALAIDPTPGTVMAYIAATACAPTEHTVSASTKVYCKVTTAKDDLPTAAEIIVSDTAPTDAHAQPDPGGNTGAYHYLIADFEETDDGTLTVKTQYHKGGPINHRPGRNNRNLKVIIEQRFISYNACDGLVVTKGSDQFMFFRQGLYVGVTDPGLGEGETQDVKVLSRITNTPTSTEG